MNKERIDLEGRLLDKRARESDGGVRTWNIILRISPGFPTVGDRQNLQY